MSGIWNLKDNIICLLSDALAPASKLVVNKFTSIAHGLLSSSHLRSNFYYVDRYYDIEFWFRMPNSDWTVKKNLLYYNLPSRQSTTSYINVPAITYKNNWQGAKDSITTALIIGHIIWGPLRSPITSLTHLLSFSTIKGNGAIRKMYKNSHNFFCIFLNLIS